MKKMFSINTDFSVKKPWYLKKKTFISENLNPLSSLF